MLWENSTHPVPYGEAVAKMESHVKSIISGRGHNLVWFLEHPPLYTQGTDPRATEDIKNSFDELPFPIYPAGRGGRLTYHGPGQQVVYCIIDLKRLYEPPSIHTYLNALQTWVITLLKEVGIEGFTIPSSPGIWVIDPLDSTKSLKIASFGIRVRKWVAFHGFSLNVTPDLTHFNPIVPCGNDSGMTSLHALGITISKELLHRTLQEKCPFFR